MIIVICLLMEKKSLSLKLTIKMLTFQLHFVLEAYLKDISSATKLREVSLNENVYNFAVNYNFVDKSDILNIQKYLMVKKNIKCLTLIGKCLLCY